MRGRGLGHALSAATWAEARAAGFSKLVIAVREDNPQAQAFYTGLGFQPCGRLTRQAFVDGKFVDELLYELFLGVTDDDRTNYIFGPSSFVLRPLGGNMTQLRKLWNDHPNLVSWLILAVGMVVIVVIAARNVGFTTSQWAALIAATIGLAGLCVWIISWEDGEDEAQAAASKEAQTAAPKNE